MSFARFKGGVPEFQVFVTCVADLALILGRTKTREVSSVQGAHASVQTGVGPTGVQI